MLFCSGYFRDQYWKPMTQWLIPRKYLSVETHVAKGKKRKKKQVAQSQNKSNLDLVPVTTHQSIKKPSRFAVMFLNIIFIIWLTIRISYSIYSELSNQLPAGKITNNELYKSSGLVATFFGKSLASKKSLDFSPLSRCRITPLRGTQVENRFFTVSVRIPRHPVIFSDDDWGVQSPPKRIVLRFHYHSQFRWLDP